MKNKIWRIIEHSIIAQYLVVMMGTAIALLLLYWFISHVDILWYDLFRCPAPFSALEFDEVGDVADGRVRVADNGQEWILDTKSRELVPAPHDHTYDYLGKLSNGLRRARKTNQESFGYIDDKGREVIPFIYDYADDFHRDVARVRIKSQYTLIDRSGQEIIPRYRDVHIYGEQGFIGAEKADGGEDFFDLYGKPLTASALQVVYMARDREKAERAAREAIQAAEAERRRQKMLAVQEIQARLKDEGLLVEKKQRPQITLPANYFRRPEDTRPSMTAFRHGVALKRTDHDWYLVDRTGRTIAGPFTNVRLVEEEGISYPFGQNMPLIPVYTFYPKKGYSLKAGYINAQGKTVVGLIYDQAEPFYEGRGRITKTYLDADDRRYYNKYGFVDENGKEIVSTRYWGARNYAEGWAAVCRVRNGKWRFIDRQGCPMVKP